MLKLKTQFEDGLQLAFLKFLSLTVFQILSVWHGNSTFNAQGTKCKCKSLPDMSNSRVGLEPL